ncbi:MAG: DUF370 domain-containing protein [Oscillospiraceae bacterium]|nr:DUF370 domain-containing protein [Oscillospiraceae bacterium]
MYLHLGEETAVRSEEIIGIFDIENTSVSKHTKEFLASAGKSGIVRNVSYEMPKSFIVCSEKGVKTVYISPISAATLKKRGKAGFPSAKY